MLAKRCAHLLLVASQVVRRPPGDVLRIDNVVILDYTN